MEQEVGYEIPISLQVRFEDQKIKLCCASATQSIDVRPAVKSSPLAEIPLVAYPHHEVEKIEAQTS